MAELIWDGKYDEHRHKRAPVRIELPFQTVETVNESVQERYPDFVAVDKSEVHWLIETKGMESAEVGDKDLAATNWCENASALTKTRWKYVKVPQKAFEVLQPGRMADLAALGAPMED
jgi:hypothetical protein